MFFIDEFFEICLINSLDIVGICYVITAKTSSNIYVKSLNLSMRIKEKTDDSD